MFKCKLTITGRLRWLAYWQVRRQDYQLVEMQRGRQVENRIEHESHNWSVRTTEQN